MPRKVLLVALLLINSPPKLSCKGAWQFPVQILSLAEEREIWHGGAAEGARANHSVCFRIFFT